MNIPLRSPVLFTLLLLLAAPFPTSPQPLAAESLRGYVERNQRRQAYGVYLNNQKFGWALDELKLEKENGVEVAVHTFEIQSKFTAFGEHSEFHTKSVAVYSVAEPGLLLRAQEDSTEDGHKTQIRAARENQNMRLIFESKAGRTERIVPQPEETLAQIQKLDLWLTKGPKKGATFRSVSTSWDRDEINVPEITTFRGKKTILWGGVQTEVFLVSVNVEGMIMECEVLSDGTPIKGFMGGIFEIRAEKEAVARQLGTELVDMLQASSIKVNKDLGEPETVERLKLRITGLGDYPLPESPRQKILSRRGKTLVLETRKDSRQAKASPLTASEQAAHLKSTPAIQSTHETIRALAMEIVGPERNPLARARLLQDWAFLNIRQTMAANTSTALDVLHTRAGDCTEITMLFVALARACGIPAREVGGIMFANEGEPLFGWHAWAEIHDGHQWVSIDPTWNQVYVDATHIKLDEGSNDWTWVNLLGKIKIKVLDFKAKK